MPLRRISISLLSITILITLSILLLASFGESFKVLAISNSGPTLRKRDGMTITFSLPWKSVSNPSFHINNSLRPADKPRSAVESKHNGAKTEDLSPVLGSLLGDVSNVASAILDNGENEANDISTEAGEIQSQAQAKAESSTQVSVMFNGAPSIVASILSEVNGIVSEATGVIGGVVGDATSIVGMIVGGITSDMSGGSAATNSGEPQEFLPQTRGSTGGMNMTSPATLAATSSPSAAPAAPPCPMATMTITPCCPPANTVTCTVTETWHSTHYESTQTLYSFLSVHTVTCTETVSVCLPPNPYLFSQNNSMSASSNQSLIACANGVLAKRQEDCPDVSSPAVISTPRSMMGQGTSSYSGNPVPSVASLMSSVGTNRSSSSFVYPNGDCPPLNPSTPSTMASFTASMSSLSSTASSVASIASLIASIVCADGSLVLRTQDCLNDLSGSATPSLLAFRTSSIVSQATAAAINAAGPGASMLTSMIANVVLALSNVQGLTGDLLSTVMSDVASAIAAANSVTGNSLPTGGALVTVPGGAAAGILASTLGGTAASAAKGVASTGNGITSNVLPSVTGGVLAVAGPDGAAAGNVAPPLPGGVNALAGNGIESAGDAVAGSSVAAAGGNTLGHLETMVNGIPTFLPIVTTVLNGKATAVPVVDMMVNGVPTILPVVNDGGALLAGLNGGDSGLDGIKVRRRVVKRGLAGEAVPPEAQHYCEMNPDDEPCLLYGDGGGLLMKKGD